jgi:hypothetical protein
MSDTTIKKTVSPPNLSTLLSNLKKDIFSNINCIQVGKIDSYDTASQSCTIKIQMKRKISDTESKEYPLLIDCPVFVLQGGGAYIDFPIQQDDYCLVLFNDRDIDTWWDSENLAEPNTTRKHSLSDGFALVGINPKNSVLDLDGDKVRIITNDYPFELYTKSKESKIYNDNASVIMKDTGEFLIENNSGKFKIDASGNITFNDGTEAYVLGTSLETAMGILLALIKAHTHDVAGVQAGSSTITSSTSTSLQSASNPVTNNLSTQIKGK